MSELVAFSNQDGIGVITINNPPVNALSPGVPEGIAAAVGALRNDTAVTAVVLIGGGRTFIAGAAPRPAGEAGRRRDTRRDPRRREEEGPRPGRPAQGTGGRRGGRHAAV